MKVVLPLPIQRTVCLPLFAFHFVMCKVEKAFSLTGRKSKREKHLRAMWNDRLPLF